jgi:hypothetical protein
VGERKSVYSSSILNSDGMGFRLHFPDSSAYKYKRNINNPPIEFNVFLGIISKIRAYLFNTSSMILFLRPLLNPLCILTNSLRYEKHPSSEFVVFGMLSLGYF